MIVLQQIRTVQDSLRFRWSEWGCAGLMVVWGAIVLLPAASLSTPGWSVLVSWLPEWVWGAGAFTGGCIRIAVLLWNGRWVRCHQARMVLAYVSCGFWGSLLWAIISTGRLSTGIAAYLLPLVLDYGVIRIASYDANAKRLEEARRDGAG